MTDTKMLQAILDGQRAIKEELKVDIGKVDKKVEKLDGEVKKLEGKVWSGFKAVNKRLDTIGRSVAYLEDDTPTREEHDNLEKRMNKLETQFTAA